MPKASALVALPINVPNPLICYPYDMVRQSLTRLAEKTDGDPHEGIVLEYSNPVTGGPTFPTMSLKIRLIKA